MFLSEKQLQFFFNLAFERHRIYILKTLGYPKPWTKLSIFQQYYFCNVFRRIDKTTVWFEENVIKPFQKDPNLWKAIILFRYISRISTYEKLQPFLINTRAMYDMMRAMQENGEKIFTNAFIVNSGSSTGFVDKVTYIFRLLKAYDDAHLDFYLKGASTLEQGYYFLLEPSGVGPFMAYEYTTDFSYSLEHLAEASDINKWCILGLGAVRGLSRIINDDPKGGRFKDELKLCQQIYSLWENYISSHLSEQIERTSKLVRKDDEKEIEKLYQPFTKLTMREVEHWLCEYDKYCRGGSRKRRYDGG